MSDSLWRGVVPPNRMLDPGLHRAEALLSTTLAEICSALPDERTAARRLNHALLLARATPRLAAHNGRWHIVITGRDPSAEAVAALAVLVAAGGFGKGLSLWSSWRRPGESA